VDAAYPAVCAPGLRPGAEGGMNPATRQSVPSTALSPWNRVTLQLDISPRWDRAEIDVRTLAKGIPVAAEISESSL